MRRVFSGGSILAAVCCCRRDTRPWLSKQGMARFASFHSRQAVGKLLCFSRLLEMGLEILKEPDTVFERPLAKRKVAAVR